jgi:antitoxin component YwqK of YwqJK toxin-antitoxin module
MKCIFATWLTFILLVIQAQGQYTKYYYPGGAISSEGMMENGQPNGYWKTYYEDGGLKTEGNRLQFQLDSTWKFYRSDSTLERIITYKESLKNGPEQLFDTAGKILSEVLFVNNIKNGPSKTFYLSGQVHKIIPFENNKEEGKGVEYAEDARIITNTVYRNGFIYSEEFINRYNSANKRSGIWKDLHPNGVVREEGNWTNGLRNGVFKFFNKKGELERIENYENGELVVNDGGQYAMIDIRKEYYEDGRVKLEGSYRNDKKHGTFREYDRNGNQINAYLYENEIKTGEGMIDSIGRRQGPWKLFYPDGIVRAAGNYIDGKKDGPWQFYFNNSKIEQKGSYKDDLPIGNWQWFHASGGMHRDEYYRKGKEDGHAIEYDSIGTVINEGDFVDGLKTGKWKLSVNDHIEEGEYLDGERNGLWVWYYDNGQKAFEGEYQVGTPVEKHKYWYRNGNVRMRGKYEGGELSGRWEYFDEIGTLELTIEYEAGLATRINGQKIKLPKPKEDQ